MPRNGTGPQPPLITPGLLLKQFWLDIYGKEVQSAATYSYLWMADQLGHVCIGIILDFALVALASLVWGAGFLSEGAGFAGAAAIVSAWEASAYRSDAREADGPFPLDRRLLRSNAVIAASYMGLGAALGWAFHLRLCLALVISVALAALAVALAPFWLRQKIIWQKAGLPYLCRLADAPRDMTRPAAAALQRVIERAVPPEGGPRQIILAGPVGSGRTSLASGVGTEFAFRARTVRYISLDRLIEFAAVYDSSVGPSSLGDDSGPANIGYWPWPEAQVVIIDDIGPVIELGSGNVGYDQFAGLLAGPLRVARDELAVCHTVWILGDLEKGGQGGRELQRFTDLLATYCRSEEPPLAILLTAIGTVAAIHETTASDPDLSIHPVV